MTRPADEYPLSWFIKRIERSMRVARDVPDGSVEWRQAAERSAREILSEVEDWL